MAEWRFLRGWTEPELRARLASLDRLGLGFSFGEISPGRGWKYYYSQAAIGREAPGAPATGGAFERARAAVANLEFSDPRIVTAHFDPASTLRGRRILLEIKVLGLRYLCGVAVGEVHAGADGERSVFAFRYESLEGHIERGFEWFVLTKEHASGEIDFRIHATWRRGEFPNWWSRLGFIVLARRYQHAWHRLAYVRLREIVGARGLAPLPVPGRLVHEGPLVPVPAVGAVSAYRLPPPVPLPAAEREGRERRRRRTR